MNILTIIDNDIAIELDLKPKTGFDFPISSNVYMLHTQTEGKKYIVFINVVDTEYIELYYYENNLILKLHSLRMIQSSNSKEYENLYEKGGNVWEHEDYKSDNHRITYQVALDRIKHLQGLDKPTTKNLLNLVNNEDIEEEDSELWDNRELGCDEQYVRVSVEDHNETTSILERPAIVVIESDDVLDDAGEII